MAFGRDHVPVIDAFFTGKRYRGPLGEVIRLRLDGNALMIRNDTIDVLAYKLDGHFFLPHPHSKRRTVLGRLETDVWLALRELYSYIDAQVEPGLIVYLDDRAVRLLRFPDDGENQAEMRLLASVTAGL